MMNLPQTVVIDFSKGASLFGLEFSLGADFRIAHRDVTLYWNHLSQGIPLCAGGLSLLQQKFGPQLAHQWALSDAKLNAKVLIEKMFLYQTYENFEELTLFKDISMQSPVTRIQLKKASVETMAKNLHEIVEHEKRWSQASLLTQDYQRETSAEFMSALDFSKLVQSQAEKN